MIKPEDYIYSKEEASKILGVRVHFFQNTQKYIGLEKIHSNAAGFNLEDIELWKTIIKLKNDGYTHEGIKHELENRKNKERKIKDTIHQLMFMKSWLLHLKKEMTTQN